MRFRKTGEIAAHLELARAASHNSGQLNFTPEQLQAFQASFGGDIVLPSSANYGTARQMFVPTFQFYPQIIVYCTVESDVVRAINFAQEVGLHPVVRSGGHSTAGFSSNDQMIIDMSQYSYVHISRDKTTMKVGGGTIFARINPMMDMHGVNMTGGGCATVSVGGYMQGGGYGFTALSNGMNCDCVKEVRVALADGRVVTANETEEPDLFWAVRGGTGNNFGVLIEVTYNLRPIGKLWGFGYHFPLSTSAEVVTAAKALTYWYDNWTGDNVPKGLGHQTPITFMNDKPYVFIRGMLEGTEAEAKALVAPIEAMLENKAEQTDVWQEGTYMELNGMLLTTPVELPSVPMSSRSINTSRIFGDGLTQQSFETILNLFLTSPVHTNMFVLEPYGGAINTKARGDTAFVHRDARFDMALYSFWLFEEDRAAAEGFLKVFEDNLTPLSNGEAYQNYPNRENTNFAHMYWAENLPRLSKIKKAYDPENFFRFPQSVPLPLSHSGPPHN